MSGLVSAAKEIRDQGAFGYVGTSVPTAELGSLM